MYDYESEDIQHLLYHLIDKPRLKAQEEFYKENGYPADCLGVPKPTTDPELLNRLKLALKNMSLAVPVLEIRNDETIASFDGNSACLYEHKLKAASKPSRRLRSMISASVPTREFHSLLEYYAYRSHLFETKTKNVFIVFIPLTEILKLGMEN